MLIRTIRIPMKTIGEDVLQTFLSSGWSNEPVRNHQIRSDPGYLVRDFSELVSCVAQLAFYNENHVLLYRGQDDDYCNTKGGINTTVLKPTIFRPKRGATLLYAIPDRFDRLLRAEKLLAREWREKGLEDPDRIIRQRILRWAILQHYQVCKTPLLDVSQSLRVAASFAALDAKQFGYLYVLAVPQLSGAITASAEAGLQIVRLSSICPPSARRPHFQEGYLVGEYPEIQTVEEKRNYEPYEIDFCRRLLAKFQLDLKGFRKDKDFTLLPRKALFPGEDDADLLAKVVNNIESELGPEQDRLTSGSLTQPPSSR